MHSRLKIVEGQVSQDDEPIVFSYGSFSTNEPPFPPVAHVSPPRKGVITLELLVDDSTTRGKMNLFANKFAHGALAGC